MLSPFERGRSTAFETRTSRVPSHLSVDKVSGINSTSTNNHNVYHYSQRHRLEVNYTRTEEHIINNITHTNNLQKHVERIFGPPASSSQIALGNFNSPNMLPQSSRLGTHSTFPINYRLSGILSAMLCYYLKEILDAVRDARKIPVGKCINKNDNSNQQ